MHRSWPQPRGGRSGTLQRWIVATSRSYVQAMRLPSISCRKDAGWRQSAVGVVLPLATDDVACVVCSQASLAVVENHESISPWVSNDGAASDGNLERVEDV